MGRLSPELAFPVTLPKFLLPASGPLPVRWSPSKTGTPWDYGQLCFVKHWSPLLSPRLGDVISVGDRSGDGRLSQNPDTKVHTL